MAGRVVEHGFAERAHEQVIDHLTLDVATRNEAGREVWRRLGFTEWAQRLTVPIERLEQHGARGESYASLHVQSDDLDVVRAQVDKYLPRLGGGTACYLGEVAGALLLALGYSAGLYVAAVSTMVLFAFLISGAWLLIVGIYEGQGKP